ncbi:ras association domain-containing protein 8 isoform X2 [Ictidomys tridecemlineatus]
MKSPPAPLPVCGKGLLLSRVTLEGSFTSLSPGLWKILLLQASPRRWSPQGVWLSGPQASARGGPHSGGERARGRWSLARVCPRAAPRSPAARKLPQCSAGVPVPLHSLARRRRAAEARAGEPGGRGCNPSARPRGAPPRRSSRALSPRPGEGAEPPGHPARPGPAPGPAPSPEAPAAGASRPPTRPPALVRRPAQRPPRCSSSSLARTPAARRQRRSWGRLLPARSRTRHPCGWRPHSPSRPRRCTERARRGAGASRRCGTRAGGTPGWAARGLALGSRRAPGAAVSPAPPSPQPPAGLRERRSCETECLCRSSQNICLVLCCALPQDYLTLARLRDSCVLSLCLLCVLEARHDLTL